jgi:hypothetical protein
MSLELNQVDLALKIQATLQRKILDQQASNVLALVQSVTADTKSAGGRDDRLGRGVDLKA